MFVHEKVQNKTKQNKTMSFGCGANSNDQLNATTTTGIIFLVIDLFFSTYDLLSPSISYLL